MVENAPPFRYISIDEFKKLSSAEKLAYLSGVSAQGEEGDESREDAAHEESSDEAVNVRPHRPMAIGPPGRRWSRLPVQERGRATQVTSRNSHSTHRHAPHWSQFAHDSLAPRTLRVCGSAEVQIRPRTGNVPSRASSGCDR